MSQEIEDQAISEEQANEILKQSVAEELLTKLSDAHARAAFENKGNVSTTAALIAYDGSRSIAQSIAAAILTIGGKHAPVIICRNLVAGWEAHNDQARMQLEGMIRSGSLIPGLGNSFFKDSIDPSFQDVYDSYVKLAGPDNAIDRIVSASNHILSELKGKEVKLYPNAALITAAIAHHLNMPPFYEIQIFIESRMPVWLRMIANM